MPLLKIQHPGLEPAEYRTGSSSILRIGRETDNAIILDEDGVSRHHAELRLEGGSWVLHDLGSTNGTYVAEKRTGSLVLKDGACFQIGQFSFSFVEDKAPAEGLPPKAAPVPAGTAKSAGTAAKPKPTPTPGPEPTTAVPAAVRAVSKKAETPRALAPAPVAVAVEAPERPPLAVWTAVGLTLLAASAGAWWYLQGNKPDFTEPAMPFPALAAAGATAEKNRPALSVEAPAISPLAAKRDQTAPPAPAGPTPGHEPGLEEVTVYQQGQEADGSPVISPDLRQVLHHSRRDVKDWQITDVLLNGKAVRTVRRVEDIGGLRFSEDGSSWLVHATDSDGRQALLLPGRTLSVEGQVQALAGSRDFSTVAYVSRVGVEDRLYLNDDHRSTYANITGLCLSGDGSHWAYVAVKQAGLDAGSSAAGERVMTDQGPQDIHAHVSHLTLSADGSRTAYVAEDTLGARTLVVDGQDQKTGCGPGGHILALALAPESGGYACLIQQSEGGLELHLEGRPALAVPARRLRKTLVAAPPVAYPAGRILFSPDGREVAAAALTEAGAWLWRNGKVAGPFAGLQLDSLTFSPDGRRLAWVAHRSTHAPAPSADGTLSQVYEAALTVDGETVQSIQAVWSKRPPLPGMALGGYSGLRFSPDGRLLACLVSSYDPQQGLRNLGLHVDGKALPETAALHAMHWSTPVEMEILKWEAASGLHQGRKLVRSRLRIP